MKTLLLAGLMAAHLGVQAQSSPSAPVPPRRANVAVVHSGGNAHDAYAQLGQVLVGAGYDLEKATYDADKGYRELAYVTTIDRFLPDRPTVRVALQAVLVAEPTGPAIQLWGTYSEDGLTFSPIASGGRKGSVRAAAWTELQRVAGLFPTGATLSQQQL